MTKKTLALSVCLLSLSSLALADTFYPGQEIPGYPEQQTPAPSTGGLSGLFHKIGDAIKEAVHPLENKMDGKRHVVDHMRANSQGCLSLAAGEDYYPLRSLGDAELVPKSFIPLEPNVAVTFHMNELGSAALLQSRNNVAIEEWPLIIHGPVAFCGRVDFQFQAGLPNFVSRRSDAVEIGPNVYLHGNQDIDVVSSQLKNLDVEASCGPSKIAGQLSEEHTPCILLENDLSLNSNSRLYVKYTGNVTCRLVQLTLDEVRKGSLGSKDNPMPCEQLESLSGNNDMTGVDVYSRTETTTVIKGVVTTRDCTTIPTSTSCDGPYYAPIRPTNVPLNYGLTTPVIQQPVQQPAQLAPLQIDPIAPLPPIDTTIKPLPAMLDPQLPTQPIVPVNPKTLAPESVVNTTDPKTLTTRPATVTNRQPRHRVPQPQAKAPPSSDASSGQEESGT